MRRAFLSATFAVSLGIVMKEKRNTIGLNGREQAYGFGSATESAHIATDLDGNERARMASTSILYDEIVSLIRGNPSFRQLIQPTAPIRNDHF